MNRDDAIAVLIRQRVLIDELLADLDQPEEIPGEPLDHRCSMCGAPPGAGCRTRHGTHADYHQDRLELADGASEPQPCACRPGGWACYKHDPLRHRVAQRNRWLK